MMLVGFRTSTLTPRAPHTSNLTPESPKPHPTSLKLALNPETPKLTAHACMLPHPFFL